jgi:enoyl-CoA hydratase
VGSLVRYELNGSVAKVTLDDGKVNVLSVEMLSQMNQALDQVLCDEAVCLLAGRDGIFSAGFDLAVLRSGGPEALTMLRGGFDLAERLLSFPRPVVIACTGHAVAMGVFLLLSGDYRIGAVGPYKITANEVAIGLTLPRVAVEIMRQRLTVSHFNRAAILAEVFDPAEAVRAGFLDQVVPPEELAQAAAEVAESMTELDMTAHYTTKIRVRDAALKAIREAMITDGVDVGVPTQ